LEFPLSSTPTEEGSLSHYCGKLLLGYLGPSTHTPWPIANEIVECFHCKRKSALKTQVLHPMASPDTASFVTHLKNAMRALCCTSTR